MSTRKERVKQVAYLQAKEFLVVFLYLWLIFALFEGQKAIILARAHMEFGGFGFAFINALALAKFMMIAREMNLADNIFKERPLIYPTLLKSLVFATLLTVLRILEEVIVHLFKGHSLAESLSALVDHNAKIVVAAGMIMFVMLIPFFAFTELSRHFGEGRLGRLFLHSRHNWLAADAAKDGGTLPSPGK
ncbi:MAG: hypothetical protein WBW33_01845 [Bryobacteraceae bacterium]